MLQGNLPNALKANTPYTLALVGAGGGPALHACPLGPRGVSKPDSHTKCLWLHLGTAVHGSKHKESKTEVANITLYKLGMCLLMVAYNAIRAMPSCTIIEAQRHTCANATIGNNSMPLLSNLSVSLIYEAYIFVFSPNILPTTNTNLG